MRPFLLLLAVTALTFSVTVSASAATRDGIGAYNFTIEIEGIDTSGVTEVTGLGADVDVIEYQDGSGDLYLRKRPGRAKYGNITLKKSLNADPDGFYQWWENVSQGNTDARPMTITLLDGNGKPVAQWRAFSCWPKAWRAPDLSGSSLVPEETIEISVEKIERVHPPK